MEAVLDVRLNIPESDYRFFGELATKMGWTVKTKQNLWDEYMRNSPQNVPLSEEEIIEEVMSVRYGKA